MEVLRRKARAGLGPRSAGRNHRAPLSLLSVFRPWFGAFSTPRELRDVYARCAKNSHYPCEPSGRILRPSREGRRTACDSTANGPKTKTTRANRVRIWMLSYDDNHQSSRRLECTGFPASRCHASQDAPTDQRVATPCDNYVMPALFPRRHARLRYFELTHKCRNYKHFRIRRGGRVAEGGGLLNRYTV